MTSENINWLYIYTIVENFENLVLYFYTVAHHYAPWFRQAGYALIFSVGMFAVGVQMFKIPFDRMKGVGYTFGMIALASFLNSPTTNTKAFAPIADKELSIGGYWSYHIGHQVTSVFRSTLSSVWDSTLREMAGASNGLVSESMDIAWSNNAKIYADKFLQGVGQEAYLDYMTQCARPLEKALKSDQDRRAIRHVGVGSHMLGMSEEDASAIGQARISASLDEQTFLGRMAGNFNASDFFSGWIPKSIATEMRQFDSDRRRAEELLKTKLADENNPITGVNGYMIPTVSGYKEAITSELSSTGSNSFEQLSSMGPSFAEMKAKGAVLIDANSSQDYTFYPRNCYDLYLVTNKTMENFRKAVKDQDEYKNLALAKSYQSQSASMHVSEALRAALNERLQRVDVDIELSQDNMRVATDVSIDIFRKISEWVNKVMINYKVPALITSMALISVLLVISFPLFATLSVIFGHKVLVTYLKLVALPFLIVFINQLLIQLSTNIIAFNNQQALVLNTFYPGTSEASSALSGQNIKSIIFTVLTVAELAIVKFLLFDDYRAVTSGNFGATTTNAAADGVKTAGVVAGATVAAVSTPLRIKSAIERFNKGNNNQTPNSSNVASAVAGAGSSTLQGYSHGPVTYSSTYKPQGNFGLGSNNSSDAQRSRNRDLSGQSPKQ